MAQLHRRAVLFADLRGSTGLFESLGNRSAADVVGQAVSAASAAVSSSGGRVVKTLGDGLMAVFADPESALQSAMRMQETLNRLVLGPADAHGEIRLQLQTGIAYGEVVEVAGDCLGDAVNLAARLVEHAGDSEILISEEVFDAAPPQTRALFLSLGQVQVRGRAEPVGIYLHTSRHSDTAATLFGDSLSTLEPLGIRLRWRDVELSFAADELPVRIGRGASAEFAIEDPRVSRSHARVEGHGGALQLVDLSINGTYVRFSRDDEVLSLRRGSCTLHGSGWIGLGGAPDDPDAAVLSFDVMRPATVPARS